MNENSLGKADLHTHTTHSYDGISTPEEIVKHAAEIGLDVVAITDHDEISGGLEAEKFEKKYGVDVIVGEEVLTNEGEIIALFIKKKIETGKSLFDTIGDIRKQGGLVLVPHPFSIFPMTRPAVGLKNLYQLFKEKKCIPDAIEIINSMPAGKGFMAKNKRLNEGVFLLAEVAGSDCHIQNHLGLAMTLFPGKTKEDLRQAILEKKTEAVGEFVSRKEAMRFIKGNLMKMGKKTKDKVLKPYKKIKTSLKHMFHPSK